MGVQIQIRQIRHKSGSNKQASGCANATSGRRRRPQFLHCTDIYQPQFLLQCGNWRLLCCQYIRAPSHSFGWDFIWKCIRAQSVCCRFNICFQDFSFRMIYACIYLVSPNLGVTDVMTRPDLYLLMRSYRCPHLGTRICCICLYLLSHNRHLYLGPFLYCADISRIHYVIQNQNCRLKIILASDLQDHHLYPFKRSDVSNWSILAVKGLLFGQKGPD